MLSTRFGTLRAGLRAALDALTVSGRTASAVVLAIVARVALRCGRLETLMDRFEAGTLRTRAFAPRKTFGQACRTAPVPVERGVAGAPSVLAVPGGLSTTRARTSGCAGTSAGAGGRTGRRSGWECATSRCGCASWWTTDAVMRGLLGVSRSARREARWCLRMTGREAMPEILREPAAAPAGRAPRRRDPRRPR